MLIDLKKTGRLELFYILPAILVYVAYLFGFLPEYHHSPMFGGYSEFLDETKHKNLVSWVWMYFEYTFVAYVLVELIYVKGADVSSAKWPGLIPVIFAGLFCFYLVFTGTPWTDPQLSRKGRVYSHSDLYVFFVVTVTWLCSLFLTTKAISFFFSRIGRFLNE